MKRILLLTFLLCFFAPSCIREYDPARQAEGSYSGECLRVSLNSAVWAPEDYASAEVVVRSLDAGMVSVLFNNVLRDEKSFSTTCSVIQTRSAGTDSGEYRLEGEYAGTGFSLNIDGRISGGTLVLDLEYASSYDFAGRWMCGEREVRIEGNNLILPDISLDMTLPEGETFLGEPVPAADELQEYLRSVNTVLRFGMTGLSSIDFTAEGYINIRLTSEAEESLGVSSETTHNLIRYFAHDGYLHGYLLPSALKRLAGEDVQLPEGWVPEIIIPYTWSAGHLDIRITEAHTAVYAACLSVLVESLSYEEVSGWMTEEEFRVLQAAVGDIVRLANHPDTRVDFRCSFIPWSEGERPWSSLVH